VDEPSAVLRRFSSVPPPSYVYSYAPPLTLRVFSRFSASNV
jgi:hypothetical protein